MRLQGSAGKSVTDPSFKRGMALLVTIRHHSLGGSHQIELSADAVQARAQRFYLLLLLRDRGFQLANRGSLSRHGLMLLDKFIQ